MSIRVAINGFGRIGRCVLRAVEGTDVEIVALNDLTDAKTLAHLLKYDSVHGRFAADVKHDEKGLYVNGRHIVVLAEKDPAKLPWREKAVDIVIESTGLFTDKPKAEAHLHAGAKRVLVSAPGKGVDATFAYGVNHETYDPSKHTVVSAASCTTNCLAPVAKVLHDTVGIEHGLMTTIHSITNDQRILDLPHKDLRRARAAYESMIPTTTGAAKAVGEVLPALKGKLNGFAMRVPTKDVSVVDLVARVARDTTKEEVNDALRVAAAGPLKGVLAATDEPLVSIDFIGTSVSSTADLALTDVMEKRMVKVVAWYDNEWGYSCRVADLVRYMGSR
ncbi:MAG: type I glyceraldehyde-3-phosphate dehydrogenase [Deltaproteobacteria bacterium]|nr:type I glyceraldehyde-3-phosphate dehydrogenase [Deltaproteobacteria bacterium]